MLRTQQGGKKESGKNLREYSSTGLPKAHQELKKVKEAQARLEHRAKESEEKFQALAEESPNMIFIYALKKRQIVYANEACVKATGYKREELYSPQFNFLTLIAPESHGVVKEILSKHLKGVRVLPYEYKILTKDGQKIDVVVNTKLIRYQEGVAILGIVTDISYQKQMEQKLRQKTADLALINQLNKAVNQGESLQQIFDIFASEVQELFACQATAFYLLSEDKKHLIMRALSFPANLMKKVEKLIKGPPPEVTIPLKKESVYRKLLEKGEPTLVNNSHIIRAMIAEHAVNQALKKLVPALHKLLGIRSVIVLPLFSDGQPIGLVNISRDKPFTFSELKRFKVLTEEITTIVKRKMIEESLEKSEKQLRLITESARDIILMQDLDGKYLYYNAPPYYGLKADDVVGKTPYDFFEPEVAERIINRNKKVAKLAKRITEIEQINWQGETMYFSAEVTPVIDSAGKTAAITTILRNITELIEAEKELAKEKAAKEKLAQKVLQTQEAERKKIAIEVHDTLLQQLLAMSSWLSAIKVAHPHLDKPLQEKLDKFANTLRKAIKNSRFLISDLRPLLLETRGLPHALKEFVGKRCSEAKVECVLQIGKIPKIDENLEITIFRIVQEATLNALRHAQPSKIEVSLSSNKENITAKIKDNGRGFDYNSHKFWEERMATHLGITAMKERAAMFGGNLKIESSEEAGTEVIATFPLKKRRR